VGIIFPAGEVANHAVMHRQTLPPDLFLNHEGELSANAAPILFGHLSECLH
jgi:hypothetical protein